MSCFLRVLAVLTVSVWFVFGLSPRVEAQDLLSLSIGYFDEQLIDPGVGFLDVSETDEADEAVDFRAEYRPDLSLISLIEPWASLRPWVGLEMTSDLAIYGAGGLLVDIPIGPVVVTPSAGLGLYGNGNGKDMGSILQFRTQLELGYRFENASRVSLAYSHISNADIAETNPGANILSVYYHMPLAWVIGEE